MPLQNTFCYFQKAALVQNVLRYVARCAPRSLLDIGAGTPSTAVPLSKSVAKYVAIEHDPTRAASLAAAGLPVVHGEFPLKIDGAFDFVLLSHCLPHRDIENFLLSALELVAINGTILIVTFKGSRGDIHALRKELTGLSDAFQTQIDEISQALSRFGQVEIERVNSYAVSSSVGELVKFLQPWIFSNRREHEKSDGRLTRILNTRYKINQTYIFPTQHVFISLKRDR